MIQQTLVLVKPDGVMRGLIGECVSRFEKRGLKIVAMKMLHADDKLLLEHYGEDIAKRHGEHVRKVLIDFIKMGPVVAMVLEGIHAVEAVRKICGSTYPGDAMPGTIRGDFAHASKEYCKAVNKGYNVVHASGSIEEAEKEISLWFKKDEINNYKLVHEDHVF